MELVCNLVWLTAAIVLWSIWFARGNRVNCGSQRSAIAVQLVALAALTAILLPVISITDDLQAANNPAEVVRCADKRDQLLLPHSPHLASGAVALIVPCVRPCLMCRMAILAIHFSAPVLKSDPSLARWSRPPPVA